MINKTEKSFVYKEECGGGGGGEEEQETNKI